jgi:hypothetical protein
VQNEIVVAKEVFAMAKKICLAGIGVLACFISAAVAQTEGPYVIHVRLIDASGLPVSRGSVSAYRENEPGRSVTWIKTDQDGHVTIRLREPGVYLLVPNSEVEGYVAGILPFFKDPSTPATRVTLSREAESVEASIVLPPVNGAMVGTAVDAATNLPIEDVRFTMCHADNRAICFTVSAKDARGRFRINTPHVPFLLKISAEGYQDWLGLSGSGGQERVFVPSAIKTQLRVHLNRVNGIDRPLSDAEKSAAVFLPAPIQLSPADNIEFDHYPRTTTLEWAAVEGAVSYTIEIDYCQRGIKDRTECVRPQPFSVSWNPPLSDITTTSYTFLFLGAQPGRWRVWALDKNGSEGFKSDWRRFFYAR